MARLVTIGGVSGGICPTLRQAGKLKGVRHWFAAGLKGTIDNHPTVKRVVERCLADDSFARASRCASRVHRPRIEQPIAAHGWTFRVCAGTPTANQVGVCRNFDALRLRSCLRADAGSLNLPRMIRPEFCAMA